MEINYVALKRQARLATALTMVSSGIILSSLLISYLRLNHAAATLKTVEVQVKQKRAEVETLESQKRVLQSSVASLKTEQKAYAAVLNEVPKPILDKAFNANPQAAGLIPKVYVHIASEEQRPQAKQATEALKAAGFTIPGIENVGFAKSPNKTQIRYFYQEDATSSDLKQIESILSAAGLHADPTLVQLGAEKRPNQKQYELWLAKPVSTSSQSPPEEVQVIRRTAIEIGAPPVQIYQHNATEVGPSDGGPATQPSAETAPSAVPVVKSVDLGDQQIQPTASSALHPDFARISGGVMAGLITSKTQPVYPLAAQKAHVQGTVVLHVLIGKDGKVIEATVLSGHPLLTEAALDAVAQWTFKPYLLNGEPTAVDTTLNINFELPDHSSDLKHARH